MKNLFNDNWQFCELPLNEQPDEKDYFSLSKNLSYSPVSIPHDWQIWHIKDLYKNSIGFYKKSFNLTEKEITERHISIRFEGVYMNSSIWVNGKKAGEWKYGYSTFEFDISELVTAGQNEIVVIVIYQHCNTRWYSGAGIFRDVWLNNTGRVFLTSDGGYFRANKSIEDRTWDFKGSFELSGDAEGTSVRFSMIDNSGKVFWKSQNVSATKKDGLWKAETQEKIFNPAVWDVDSPDFYILKTELLDCNGKVIDTNSEHFGFKTAVFDSTKGFFLNGRHLKIKGACHHHDHGVFGSAFNIHALRRQFLKLKEMGVNAIRCSHNPPPKAWLDLCDELGLMVDDEIFDMWENHKTPYDYASFFKEWHEKDTENWVKRDRNHPSLIMWSIGNEISDTMEEKGLTITKNLYSIVRKNDPDKVAPITSASNYMMTEGAQKCANELDLVGYNYLEYLYNPHHQKNPDWKIYGSETSSTVQSRGIYHFPENLKLVTFSDGQCSALGNCSTSWGAKNTQTVITNERDCTFSAGQFIWTGWDYIGEPTPYHTKNSYFGQIDTAGFPKDTFYLYKSEWTGKKAEPFVHLLPYWDWNEGQIVDVKAYSNCDAVELFVNGKSLGLQKIDHLKSMRPFGQWQVEYHKGEIKAVGYDCENHVIAEDVKKSFGDPAKIIMQPEERFGNLFFIDLMTADSNGTLVENARNYITFNVAGKAELVGMDNGDSTDYDEYKSDNGNSHSRRLFANRLVAVIRTKTPNASFVITAASEGLDNVSLKFDGEKWVEAAPYLSIHPVYDFIPARKIEISVKPTLPAGNLKLNKQLDSVCVTAKVLPKNATCKNIEWHTVLKECVPANYISICDKAGEGSGEETATLKAQFNGECILRCVTKNNSMLDEVISDLNILVTEFDEPKLNPYTLIEGCKAVGWDKSKGRPSVSLESGITTRGLGSTWVSFDRVDFGDKKADTIHIPIFSFESELPIEVWDGKPSDNESWEQAVENKSVTLLGKFTYKHESIYNTFNENIFQINKSLSGLHSISFFIPHELEFKGFYFE